MILIILWAWSWFDEIPGTQALLGILISVVGLWRIFRAAQRTELLATGEGRTCVSSTMAFCIAGWVIYRYGLCVSDLCYAIPACGLCRGFYQQRYRNRQPICHYRYAGAGTLAATLVGGYRYQLRVGGVGNGVVGSYHYCRHPY